jgi:microcystin-dependent protein
MANYEATRYDFDGANLTGIEGIPTGTITPWSQASAPTGFLECDGAAVSRSTYAALFAVVSTTYGAGDGSTTFNLPELTDRVACGKSNNKNFASTGGANTVTPTGNVAGSTANATLSTAQLASHAHPFSVRPEGVNPGFTLRSYNLDAEPAGSPSNPRPFNAGNNLQAEATTAPQSVDISAGSGQGHSHNMSANFAGDANSVLQPFLTLIYIIKT